MKKSKMRELFDATDVLFNIAFCHASKDLDGIIDGRIADDRVKKDIMIKLNSVVCSLNTYASVMSTDEINLIPVAANVHHKYVRAWNIVYPNEEVRQE
jgi:hypothetical protein